MSQHINLLDRDLGPRRFSATSAEGMLYALGAILLLGGAYAAYIHHRVAGMEETAKSTGQEYQTLTTQRDALTAEAAARTPDAALAAEIKTLESQLGMRNAIIDTLKNGKLGTTLGFSEYLRAFSRQTVGGLWLTGFDIQSAGNQMTLSGRVLKADLLPEYLKRLNREPALQGRQFAAFLVRRPPPTDAAAGAAATPAALTPGAPAASATPVSATPVADTQPSYLEFTITTATTIPESGKAQQ